MVVRHPAGAGREIRADSGQGSRVAVASRRTGSVSLARGLLVLATLWVGGCSFALARRPPPYSGAVPSLECTKSVAPAVVDTTLATMYAGLTVGNEVARLRGDGAWFVGSLGLSILLGMQAAITGASAAWGFDVAHECRAALGAQSDAVLP
jgi:hypothetical protein